MNELEDILGNDIRIIAAISWACALLVGFTGNVFVISVITKIRRKKCNIPNSLILLLAVFDLINVVVTYTMPMMVYIHGKYLDRGLLCNMQTVFMIFSNSLSVLVLLGIVFERFYAVAQPYSYQEHMSSNKNNKIFVFFILCLLSAAGISLPTILKNHHNELYFPGTYCMFALSRSAPHGLWKLIFYTTILSLVVLLIFIASLGSIYTVLKMKTFSDRHSTSNGTSAHSEEFLFMRLSLVTLVVFSVIWIPLLVTLCVSLGGQKLPVWYTLLSFRLAALHSIVNPWLYPILRKRFRKALKWYVENHLHYITCSMTKAPQHSLDEILQDSTTVQTNDNRPKSGQQQQQRRNDEGPVENIGIEIAQRNMTDYIDADPSAQCGSSYDVSMDNISNDHDVVVTSTSESNHQTLHEQLEEKVE